MCKFVSIDRVTVFQPAQPPHPLAKIKMLYLKVYHRVLELKGDQVDYLCGREAVGMSSHRGYSSHYSYQIKHWNPLVSLVILLSCISECKLATRASYNTLIQPDLPHLPYVHITPPHLYVKPNTTAKQMFRLVHPPETLSLPSVETKMNHICITFHFHNPLTENIKTSVRVTPGARCFIFIALCPI